MSFTWVPFYREVATRVLEYEDRQDELLALLYEMRERNLSPILLNDRDENNQMFDLEVIDPFTFFASWNRGSKDSSRLGICRFLREKWNLKSEIPRDFDGIPTVNPQSSWFFSYARTRESNDIATLWRIARFAVENEIHAITPDEWSRSLAVAQVGVAKLTMGLFWLAPDKFLTLDANTVDYVRKAGVQIERADLDKKKLTLARYREILSAIHDQLGNDNLKISLDAYGGETARFTWVPFYREVAGRVLEYEDRQDELLDLLREMKAAGLPTVPLEHDKPKVAPLETIDPFTFMANFARTLDPSCRHLCEWIKHKWKIEAPIPSDFSGRIAARTNYMGSWFFGSLSQKKSEHIQQLWKLARQVYGGNAEAINTELFEECANYPNLPTWKLSIGCSWMNPSEFLPLHDCVLRHAESLGIHINESELLKGNFDQYLDLMRNVRQNNADLVAFVASAKRDDIYETKDQLTPLMPDFPLNQILYGPPGTGKTFGTIKHAVEIIDGTVVSSHAEAKVRFDALRKAGQIEFVTFHQSFSYEEFIEGLRPILDEDGEGQARYEIRDGVLKTLALRALGDGLVYNGGFEKCWDNLIEKIQKKEITSVKYLADFSYEVTVSKSKIIGSRQGEKDVEISKSSLSKLWDGTLHLRFIEQEDVSRCLGANWPAKDFAVAVMNEMSLEIQGRPIDEKQKFLNGDEDYAWEAADANRYVLIVDEINRGNISKILGELITLLEPDKRIGAPNALSVQLPVSGAQFALPPNLYLLGTMNTADKSLALLDVALRRRFDFIEMAPDPEHFPNFAKDVLKQLNLRLEAALDREHRIGHAYFMKSEGKISEDDFNLIFLNKIIPLLQEFFYNDWETLRAVLGESGDNGAFIKKLAAPTGLKARTKWRWWFDDEGADNFDILETLRRNYDV